jgi:hypothetical protein
MTVVPSENHGETLTESVCVGPFFVRWPFFHVPLIEDISNQAMKNGEIEKSDDDERLPDDRRLIPLSPMTWTVGTILRDPDHLGFSDALNEKHGTFGCIFQQEEAPAHTSQATLDWFEESVNVIMD